MKQNVKNSPVSIRLKPLDGKRVQIIVIESNTGLEYIHVLNYTQPIIQGPAKFEAEAKLEEIPEEGESNDD